MARKLEWIGVDVSKRTLDVFSPRSGAAQFPNTPDGCAALAARYRTGTAGFVLEATGGYEQLAHRALTANGLAASIVNPARVRAFAQGTGQLAKTDKIDAQILSTYAAFRKPAPTALPSSKRSELKDLLAYRAQIVAEITARSAQLRHFSQANLKARAEGAIESLTAERKGLEADIQRLMASEPEMKPAYDILTSTPGVGTIVAGTLIAELPELGALSRRQIASLAGLAPFPRESGQRKGYRAIRGGRAEVRNALFNAARVAMRYNPKIKIFADRLAAKSKPAKTVTVAAMRKLLTILNAMIKAQNKWAQA